MYMCHAQMKATDNTVDLYVLCHVTVMYMYQVFSVFNRYQVQFARLSAQVKFSDKKDLFWVTCERNTIPLKCSF